ncbi:helix-turn-helix transcriptional regulator [Bordetella genomosp. 1]|uniref:helix-turn-helix transcriptional regulator n=1 Tax=Bordetella genomosp. 1 TaxID=1395607 RepID=UPI001C3D3735|nr:LuxR C-terminal-related transcriptional regulator [Bordetella genomosp. 1]MDQ8030830.1 LuxR C-terminal-related transcriptional regulator [Bordetella sp.]
MQLSRSQTGAIFSMMRDLSDGLGDAEVRERAGRALLTLLEADFFASYVWDAPTRRFVSCVQINMSDSNLRRYESYFQFHDPITPALQRRRRATPVSAIMAHTQLERTEFFNDFLKRDGLWHGLNFFAYDQGENIGDVRIWRAAGRPDFSARDVQLVDAIGPSLVNALARARAPGRAQARSALRPSAYGLTRREAEVADLLVLGLSDQEICDRLVMSKPTLRTHVGAIFEKCGVRRRAQLAGVLAGARPPHF